VQVISLLGAAAFVWVSAANCACDAQPNINQTSTTAVNLTILNTLTISLKLIILLCVYYAYLL
jgi:hypothetical protein